MNDQIRRALLAGDANGLGYIYKREFGASDTPDDYLNNVIKSHAPKTRIDLVNELKVKTSLADPILQSGKIGTQFAGLNPAGFVGEQSIFALFPRSRLIEDRTVESIILDKVTWLSARKKTITMLPPENRDEWWRNFDPLNLLP